MSDFLDAALGFPAVLFSFALLVVAAYWVLVLLGGLGVDALDADADTGAGADVESGDGLGGLLAGAGLGGVPVTVAFSLMIALAWFVSLVGEVLLLDVTGAAHGALAALLLVVAVAAAWLGTRLLVPPLRHAFPDVPVPSHRDFVGLTCLIRTGRVARDFGQAEVTAADGSTALVQVRQPLTDLPVAGEASGERLTLGSTALIFDYDPDGGFFWVMPYDAALDPGRPAAPLTPRTPRASIRPPTDRDA